MLEGIPDALICEAIDSQPWKLFPDTDDITRAIEVIRERNRHEAADREWRKWKAEQKRAKQEGLLATEEGIAEMRAALRKLAGKDASR